MKAFRALDFALLTAAVGLTRFLCRSRCLYDIDSVNFALALRRFDPRAHQPHPPGYFLYVLLGRLANAVFPDANTALVAISIAASCAAVAVIYALACEWFGRGAGVFSGLLFLFSPLCWFHGAVALTYIVEAFFSAAIGYLCWQTCQGKKGFLLLSAATLAAAAGFRQSSILLLGPLWALSLGKAPRREALPGIAVLIAGVFAWFVPMVRESGGWAQYFGSLYSLWAAVPGKHTIFNFSVTMSVARFITIVGIYGLCSGAAWWLPLVARRAGPVEPGKKTFTWAWLLPSLAFFTLIFLAFVNSGYLLVLSPPLFLWLGFWASELYSKSSVRPVLKGALAAGLAGINAACFLYAPLYCSYRSLRAFEADLRGVQDALRSVASPADTLIVGFDSHFLGYRHAGYYLPEYLTLQYPEVTVAGETKVFSLWHRDTSLLGEIPAGRFQSFVFFPLPPGREYQEYFDKVRGRFPKRALRALSSGGREFTLGPTRDLGLIFPTTASKAYTGNHGSAFHLYTGVNTLSAGGVPARHNSLISNR